MHASWTALRPALCGKASRDSFLSHARALARVLKYDEGEQAIDALRTLFVDSVSSSRHVDRQVLLTAGLVVTDLAMQGWQLRVRGDCVETRPPLELSEDRAGEKARIRRQELVKRDAQLRQASVQKFIRSMERSRVFNGRFTSIFSL